MRSFSQTFIRRQLVLGIVLASMVAGTADAVPCIDYGDGLRITASVSLDGGAEDILIDGSLAYLCGDMLGVFDIGDPLNPALLGSVTLPETAFRLALADGHVFAMSTSGLQIIDVTDPTTPLILGSLDIEDELGVYAQDISASAGHVYLASEGGLVAVDVSSPADPSIAYYQDDMSGYDWRVVVEDSIAYLSHALLPYGYGILQMFDLGDPLDPRILTELDLESQISMRSILIEDSRLYIVGWNRTKVIGIADHEKPRILATIGFGGQEMLIADGYMYFSRYDLKVIDMSDLSVDESLNAIDICPSSRLARSGEHLFAACGDEFQVIDISNPVFLALGGYSSPIKSRDAESIEIVGTLAFIAAGDGFQILDVADPSSPRLLSDLDLMASHGVSADGVTLHGTLAYVVSSHLSDNGFVIIDVADPSNPAVVGSVPVDDSILRMTVVGDRAYVAVHSAPQSSGMHIYDLADPLQPDLLSFIAIDYEPRHIAVQNGFAYLTNVVDLNVIDVSDPSDPLIVGSIFIPGLADEIHVQGNFAYLSDIYGLRAIDISDPESPSLVGSYSVPTYVQDIDLVGEHVYMATGMGGLSIVDVSDPGNLRQIGGYFTGRACYHCDAGEETVMIQQGFAPIESERLKLLPLQCGSDFPTGMVDPQLLSRDVSCFPNPGTGESTIRFDLATSSRVRVSVHDMNGRRLRTLADHHMDRGEQRLFWDGRDDTGRHLAAGIYLLRVETADGRIHSGRSVLLR